MPSILGSTLPPAPAVAWLPAPAGDSSAPVNDATDAQAQGWDDDDDTEGAFFAVTDVSEAPWPGPRVPARVLVPVPNDFSQALLRPPRVA